MLLFLDTANIEEIRRVNSWGALDGVTTNPSLIAKEIGRPFEEIIQEICSIVDGPISAEVADRKAGEMVAEGTRLAKIHANVTIKLPLTAEGLVACRHFSQHGVKTNLTLCFSASQALLAAKAGATFVSPFVGRLDDMSLDGMELVREIAAIYENYGLATKVLVASVRHVRHVTDAALAGAHAATVPTKVFEALVRHPLTDRGLEIFAADWKSSGRP
jgi:transaldolase